MSAGWNMLRELSRPLQIFLLLVSQATPFTSPSFFPYPRSLPLDPDRSINLRFPYPFLNTLTQVQRSIFYLGTIPVLVGLFRGANYLHGVVRGEEGDVV